MSAKRTLGLETVRRLGSQYTHLISATLPHPYLASHVFAVCLVALPQTVVGVRSSHTMNVQASQREHQCRGYLVVGVAGVVGSAAVIVPRGFENCIALASRRDMDYSIAQQAVGAGVAIVREVRGGLAG